MVPRALSRRGLFALGAAVIVGACSARESTLTSSSSVPSTDPVTPDNSPPTSTDAVETTTTAYNPLPTPDLEGAVVYDGADNPFALGVAAGDTTPRRIVLWTRLFPPAPTAGDDEREGRSFIVLWEMALDPDFSEVAFSGATRADPQYGYSVHVDIIDLEPAVRFWYRFIAGDHTSPVGATSTTPYFTLPDEFRLATVVRTASSEVWSSGFDDIVGSQAEAVLCHDRLPAGTTLDEQRAHWVTVLGSDAVQRGRAACSWFHWATTTNGAMSDEQYQAWWEHSPVRLPPPEQGDRPRSAEYWGVGNLLDLIAVDPANADDRTYYSVDGVLDRSETRFVAIATPGSVASVRTKDSPLRALLLNHPKQRFVVLNSGGDSGGGEVGAVTLNTAIGPIGDEITLPAMDAGDQSAWMLHTITPDDWQIALRRAAADGTGGPIDAGTWTLPVTPPAGPGTKR